MADEEERTFAPTEAQTNRGRMQGLGVGQQEMDQQGDPSRFQTATDPGRTEPFDDEVRDGTNADRPSQADFGDSDLAGGGQGAERGDPPRNAAGLSDVGGDLGAGTPPNVDVTKLGQSDNPEEDWGEPADEGAQYSANHTRRAERTEAERGQGAKTRAHNKDAVSRRI